LGKGKQARQQQGPCVQLAHHRWNIVSVWPLLW